MMGASVLLSCRRRRPIPPPWERLANGIDRVGMEVLPTVRTAHTVRTLTLVASWTRQAVASHGWAWRLVRMYEMKGQDRPAGWSLVQQW